MSAFQGKVRNKSQARRNSKNYFLFKDLVKQQDYSLVTENNLEKKFLEMIDTKGTIENKQTI